MTNDSIAVQERSQFLPALSIHESVARRNEMVAFVRECMVKGVDYGEIPGTGRDGKEGKSVLYKPGAEKLCTLFGFSPRFSLVEKVEDWTGQDHGGEPLFYYLYRCSMWRGNTLMAEGDGSCNTFESKYRYRKSERLCPKCKQPAIRQSKDGGGFYCWNKLNGCGARFPHDATEILSQSIGRVPNPDVCDMVNTVQKMAQKRALIAVCLIAVNASEFFTQDMEDFAPTHEQHADKTPDVPANVNRETGEVYETSFVEPTKEHQFPPKRETEEEETARLKTELDEAKRLFRNRWKDFGEVVWTDRAYLIRMLCGLEEDATVGAEEYEEAVACPDLSWKRAIVLLNDRKGANAALKHAATPEPDPRTPADHDIQEGEDSSTAFMRVATHYGYTGSSFLLLDLLQIEFTGNNADDLAQGLTRPAGMWQAAIAKLHEESAKRRKTAGETAQVEMEAL